MGGDKKSDSVIRVGRFLLIALTFLLVVPVVIGQSRHRNPTRPTISSFIASPSQILAGSSTTLSWNVANASSIVITPGSFSTTTLAGSTTMSPTSTTVYTLTATSTSGSSTATTSVYVDTTPPTIPASLTASATGTSTISLVWAPSSDSSGPGLAGYNIYRCAGASCTPSTLIGTSKNGSYGDTGLATSTVYTYAVAAYDTLGLASAKSSPASATTQGATPPTISSLLPTPHRSSPDNHPRFRGASRTPLPLASVTEWAALRTRLRQWSTRLPLRLTRLRPQTRLAPRLLKQPSLSLPTQRLPRCQLALRERRNPLPRSL